MRFEKLNDYIKTIRVKGHEVKAMVTISIAYEDTPVSDQIHFGDTAEDKQAEQEYIARFETGDLLNLIVEVKAEACGCTGTDILGGCHIQSGYKFTSDLQDTIDTYGMEQNALNDLAERIRAMAEHLKKFA